MYSFTVPVIGFVTLVTAHLDFTDCTSLVETFFAVEPVLHDDITTHMCSCVGGTISGAIGKSISNGLCCVCVLF